MNRRFGLATVVFLMVAIAVAFRVHTVSSQSAKFDLLIRAGRIVDGTGNPWFYGDVGIKGDKIAAVGRLDGTTATRVIDAEGLVVTPGYIDLHTHSDIPLLMDGTAQSKVRQGVTLDVIGESESVAPRDGLPADSLPGSDYVGIKPDWTTFTGYFRRIESQGISMNLISHVSAQQTRIAVMGYDTSPTATPAQLKRMEQLIARSMEEGAWGLVTRFESGGPEHPDEILAMAKVAAAYGGNYTSHIGSEGFQQEKELAFAIRVAEEAHMPVHVFHLKIRGKENWGTVGKYVKMIQMARDRGLDVTANQYPYTAMNHPWSVFFPVWARNGGPVQFSERLRDPAVRERIKKDPDFNTWVKEHGSWDGIVMTSASTPENKKYLGMTVAEIAKLRRDVDPADTCLNLMAEEKGRINGIYHAMSEDDVKLVMQQPWVSIASDGSAFNLEAPGVPHPRNYASNVRVLGHYVRDEHLLTLEDAIRKMTSLPAQDLGLRYRGQLREGFYADVVAFNPQTVGETSSYETPKSYAKGVPYVLVNGVLVIDKGEHTGARPGKVLYGRGYQKTGLWDKLSGR